MKNSRLMFCAYPNDRSIPIQKIRDAMPKVGDHLKKVPNIKVYGCLPNNVLKENPWDCVVTYVNKRNLWYEVEFTAPFGKFKESFKCPETKMYFKYLNCETEGYLKGHYFTNRRHYRG